MKKLLSSTKALSVLLVTVISFSLFYSTTVNAAEVSSDIISSDVCDEIKYALNNADIYHLNLSEINLDDLSVGNSIESYEYCDGLLNPLPYCLYPLSYNGELVAFAIKTNMFDSIQITTNLVTQISSTVGQSIPFSLVYDKEKCYVYTKEGLSPLFEVNHDINNRQSIQEDINQSIFNSIELNTLSSNQSLGYVTSIFSESALSNSLLNDITSNSTSSSYVSCNVSFVTQNQNPNSPTYYCWASSDACIGNYITGYVLTGMNVAAYLYGVFNYNQSANGYDSISTLNSIYGTSYSFYETSPSVSTIVTSLSSGKPVFSSWSGAYSHACVIYGINVTGGYIYIMDPEGGFASASPNYGRFFYTSLYSGQILYTTGYGA